LEAVKKEEKLDNIRKEVDGTGDALGKPLDSRIKETVVFLKALEINTGQSCEGHIDRPAPWVLIESEDEPKERWYDQDKIFQATAEKYGITLEDVKRANNMDAWREAYEASARKPETKKFKDWREKNERLQKKVAELLEQFYAEREAEEKLTIEEGADSSFWLGFAENKKLATKVLNGEATEEERNSLNKKLPQRQAEMAAFTKFLEEKYWSNE